MPASDSPDVLVARFLRANNFNETFAAFVRETNLVPESITNNSSDLTIEQILEEKKLYDLAIRFEKFNVGAGDVDFAVPYPNTPISLTTLSTAFNILSLNLASLIIPSDESTPPSAQQVIISATSDKALRIYSAKEPHELVIPRPILGLHAGPILCVQAVSQKWLLTASMAGDIAISNIRGDVVHRWEGHTKYIVKLAVSDPLPESTEAEEVRYIAAASYDKSFSVHKLRIPSDHLPADLEDEEAVVETKKPSSEYLQSVTFPETVEDVIFTKDYRESSADASSLLLIATIRDSAYLHVYSTSTSTSTRASSSSSSSSSKPFTFLSKNPLNAISTTWLTYTPTSLVPHPQHPHLIALITSSLPIPKLIIYNLSTFTVEKEFTVPVNLSAYSTGIVAWRGDDSASGIWVNSDDGVVKGIEVKTGKVKVELKAHDGRKVRCLAAGTVRSATTTTDSENDDEDNSQELLISGGFDGALKVWKAGPVEPE